MFPDQKVFLPKIHQINANLLEKDSSVRTKLEMGKYVKHDQTICSLKRNMSQAYGWIRAKKRPA